MTIWLIGWCFTMALTGAPLWRSLILWPWELGEWLKGTLNTDNGEWVDARASPPISEGEYVVYDSMNKKAHHDYFVIPEDGSKPFWNHYGSYVTHWCPLPHAPTAEPDQPTKPASE